MGEAESVVWMGHEVQRGLRGVGEAVECGMGEAKCVVCRTEKGLDRGGMGRGLRHLRERDEVQADARVHHPLLGDEREGRPHLGGAHVGGAVYDVGKAVFKVWGRMGGGV